MSYWGGLLDATRMVHERHKTCVNEFEGKNLRRMGVMAYLRTVFAVLNFGLGVLITLKIFEWV